MRFTTIQDWNTVNLINQELVNILVDTPVVLYKVQQVLTKKNIYDEAPNKVWYQGVQIPCLYLRLPRDVTEDMQTVNVEQPCEFRFLRYELQLRNIYPEIGDYVLFSGLTNEYYEIDKINENQLWAGQDTEVHSIVCGAHLTTKTTLQLDPPQV